MLITKFPVRQLILFDRPVGGALTVSHPGLWILAPPGILGHPFPKEAVITQLKTDQGSAMCSRPRTVSRKCFGFPIKMTGSAWLAVTKSMDKPSLKRRNYFDSALHGQVQTVKRKKQNEMFFVQESSI